MKHPSVQVKTFYLIKVHNIKLQLQNNDPTLTSLTVGINSHYHDMDKIRWITFPSDDCEKCEQIREASYWK